MENLIKAISDYISLSEQDVEIIKKLFVRKEYNKNHSILVSGNICREFIFVQKGLIAHLINNRDKDDIIYFSAENEFICDYDSFLGKKPSKKTFLSIENTVVYSINYDNLQQFYMKIKEGERFGRLYMESIFTDTIAHLISTFTQSAEERYLNFLKKFNHIQQRIPQYYIASFIGVTPQSLSRLRRQIAKQ